MWQINCSGRETEVFARLQPSARKHFWVIFSFLNSLRNTVRSFGDRDGDEGVTAVSGELAVPAPQELGFSVGSLPSFVSGGGTAGSKPDNKLT